MAKPKQPHKKKKSTPKKESIKKEVKQPVAPPPLPTAWNLAKQSMRFLWQHRTLFIGIALIYGVLQLVLVKGLAGTTNVSSLKSQLSSAFSGSFGNLLSGITIVAVLAGSAGSGSSATSSLYQIILLLIGSLAILWALRQTNAGHAVRVRDAFYKGMYPLVPYILVILVIGLQLIPLAIGSGLYGIVITNGIAATGLERVLWGLLCLLPALLSIRFVGSSIFALFIVTLPDMTPIKALRSARKLVRKRRLQVLRKLLFLPFVLFIIIAIIVVPIILVAAPLAQWVFFVLSVFAMVAALTYLYDLYRELLDE